MTCEFFANCRFFSGPISQWSAVVRLYQSNYCTSRFAACARYSVASARGLAAVPDGLYPNDGKGADRILHGESTS